MSKSAVHALGAKEKCHVKHPTLTLGGGTLLGASCIHPRKGFDIYIGLDWNMTYTDEPVYPWNATKESSVIEVNFKITDGSVPSDPKEFSNMLAWLEGRLSEGNRVHVGCIGGHGRTGMLMAALVQRITGNLDASEWVRSNYCKGAIETSVQIEFLRKHYGIKPVEPRWALRSQFSDSYKKSKSADTSTFNWVGGNTIWGPAVITGSLTKAVVVKHDKDQHGGMSK